MELKNNLRKKILLDREKFSKGDHLKENDIIIKNVSDFLYSKVSEKSYFSEKKLKLISEATPTGLYCPMLGEPNLLNLAAASLLRWKQGSRAQNGLQPFPKLEEKEWIS